MRRGVWEATHVPCPGGPYAIDTHSPLSDAPSEPFVAGRSRLSVGTAYVPERGCDQAAACQADPSSRRLSLKYRFNCNA
jgi:hypothetical protein